MKTKLAVCVMSYGILLAGLGLLAHQVDPEVARAARITGGAAGALCVLWGVLGLLGYRRRVWTGLTLGLVILALIPQSVNSWMPPEGIEGGSVLSSVLVTLMFLTSVALMTYLVHSSESPGGPGRQDKTSSATFG